MVKYTVKVEILKVDGNGEKTWEIIEDYFEEKNPIDARNKAIERLKDLFEFFLVELSDKISFNTVEEALERGLKDYNWILPQLHFIDEDDWPSEIYGNTDEIIDGLADEAMFYYINNYPLKMVNRIDSLGYTVQVLESNIEFLHY